MFFDLLRIILLIIFKINFFTSVSLAFKAEDCSNSPFYVKNIRVDLTKESINEARSQAEYEAKLLGFKRLIKRLIIEDKKVKFHKNDINSLIDYLKINKEANSDKRYLADFDICFNRSLVINFFIKNKLKYAETYREPIAILPIFKGPRGFVLWDEKDKWYLEWQKKLKFIDGLVKLRLAKGNFSLNRTLTANVILKSDPKNIYKLINNEKTNALLIVIAEPILMTNGKTYLSTYAKYFNKSGKFETTIYRNKIELKKASSFYNLSKVLIENEVLKIIAAIENTWKKNNLIDASIYNEVDLIIPITSVVSTKLKKELFFNDKLINVVSTDDFKNKGFLKINSEIIFYNKKTKTSFGEIKRNLFNSSKKLKYERNIFIYQKDISVWPKVIKILEKLPLVIEVKIVSLTNSQGRIIVKFMGNKRTFFQAVNEKNLIFKDLNSEQYILTN